MEAGADEDTLVGSAGDGVLQGGGGADTIKGGGSGDTIQGDARANVLEGGARDDHPFIDAHHARRWYGARANLEPSTNSGPRFPDPMTPTPGKKQCPPARDERYRTRDLLCRKLADRSRGGPPAGFSEAAVARCGGGINRASTAPMYRDRADRQRRDESAVDERARRPVP